MEEKFLPEEERKAERNYQSAMNSQNKKIYSLKRSEILRGFRSFDKIFEKSKKFYGENIIVYVQSAKHDNNNFPVKAGFFISKKKLKNRTSGIGFEGF